MLNYTKMTLASCPLSASNTTLGMYYTCEALCCSAHGCCAVECSVAWYAAQHTAIATLTESMHQDRECRVIRPTDNIFRKCRNRSQENSKDLGLGISSLQSLSKLCCWANCCDSRWCRLIQRCCRNNRRWNRGKLGMPPYKNMGLPINAWVKCMKERHSQNNNIIKCRNNPKFNSMYSTTSKFFSG